MTTLLVDDDPLVPEPVRRLFSLDQALLDDPYPVYQLMRETAPVLRWGPIVAVARYEDAKAVLRDPSTFSSVRSNGSRVSARRAQLDAETADKLDKLVAGEGLWVTNVDDPQHARLRRFVNSIFSAGRVADMRSQVEKVTHELLDAIDKRGGDEFELINDFSFRLPLQIICRLFGASGPETEMIRVWSEEIGKGIGTDYSNVDEAYEALQGFAGYVGGLIDKGRSAGQAKATDLFSELMAPDNEGQVLSDDELVAMFIQLLFAGHETTTNLIANALIVLQQNPDQRELLTTRPDLIRGAIDEFLRYRGSIHAVHRVATRDCEISGFAIRKGETVRVLVASANHDPSAFENADTLDVTRRNARQHVGLGFGIHTCLGQWLTRLESEVALTELLRRYPHYRIVGEHHMRQNLTLHGPARLDLTI